MAWQRRFYLCGGYGRAEVPGAPFEGHSAEVRLSDYMDMDFDRYTISLLLLRSDAPTFDEKEEAELQDAHMSHLADLHNAGELLAAGPVLGAPDRELRGFSILNIDPERAREIKEHDPAVRAGKYRVEVFQWLLPAGLMSFSAGHLPRSMAEAQAD